MHSTRNEMYCDVMTESWSSGARKESLLVNDWLNTFQFQCIALNMHLCGDSLSRIGYRGNYNGFQYNEVMKTW
jgi:hypothetical protein